MVRLNDAEIEGINIEVQKHKVEQPPKGLGMSTFKLVKETEKTPVRNLDVLASELPIVFTDGRFIVRDHGYVKLFSGNTLVKEFPAKKEDKIKFARDTIFKTRAPKERWRRILWNLNLTKNNWRHPKMIKEKDVANSLKVVHTDENGNEVFIIVWVFHSGYRAWYTKPKTIHPSILLRFANVIDKNTDKESTRFILDNLAYKDNTIYLLNK